MKSTAYVTTSITYPNAKPHIGHALEWVQADFISRYFASSGLEVRFLTGTDEHGLKMQQAAAKQGLSEVEYADQQYMIFQNLANRLNIGYSRFMRTTDPDHLQIAQALWRVCQQNGDIDRRLYRAWYDVKEEAFLGTVDEFPDPAVFGIDPQYIERIEEENYFFRLSRYTDRIIQLLRSNRLIVRPEGRRTELLNFAQTKGLEDISISRDASKLGWGVPVPGDPSQVMYVWFDALTNYLTASSSLDTQGRICPDRFWPPTMHYVGKDISRFHALIWPAMLMSAGLELPEELVVHGFIVAEDGRKMSKSIGNVIDPVPLLERFGADPLRWFLLKEVSSFDDSRLRVERIAETYSADLANTLGNLVNRLSNMAGRYSAGRVQPVGTAEMQTICADTIAQYTQALAVRDIQQALGHAFNLAELLNRSIEDYKPWQVAKLPERQDELIRTMGSWFFCLQTTIRLLAPALPEMAAKLAWLEPTALIEVPADMPILFPRL